MIEQHDGFSVDDLPIFNAPKRVVQRHFQHVDIFPLSFNAAARAGPILRMIFRQIEVEFLGNRARAHIGLKNFLYARHLKPGFFFRFGLKFSGRAAETVVLASPEKINTASAFVIGDLSLVNTLVVENTTDERWVSAMKEKGVTVIASQ